MYMKITAALRLILACLGFAILLNGCAGQQSQPGEMAPETIDHTDTVDHQKGHPGKPLATLNITSKVPVFKTYKISPGDVLDVVYHLERRSQQRYTITLYHTVEVRFVHVPKLDQTQQVLPDGTISLPHLGSYTVVGKTPEELRQELQKEYAGILRDPDIYVTIKNFNARVEQLRRDLHTASRGLSKLITVRPDGRASFPLIGYYPVAGRTVEDLYEELAEDYQAYMPGLKLDLFMHEQTGTNVYVVGEVSSPGAYQVKRPINVVQAVARAGGYTREGETDSVVVFRRKGDRLKAHRFNLKNMSVYGAQAINFYLQPEDVLLVPRNKISSAAQLMREISDITFFRGLGISVGYDLDDRNNR